MNFNLYRMDFADRSQQNYVGLFSTEPLHYQVRGAYIYGQTVLDGGVGVPDALYNVTYYRVPRYGVAPPERVFAPPPGTSRHKLNLLALDYDLGNTFAVLEQRLVYLSARAPRLLVTPIPAEP